MMISLWNIGTSSSDLWLTEDPLQEGQMRFQIVWVIKDMSWGHHLLVYTVLA